MKLRLGNCTSVDMHRLLLRLRWYSQLGVVLPWPVAIESPDLLRLSDTPNHHDVHLIFARWTSAFAELYGRKYIFMLKIYRICIKYCRLCLSRPAFISMIKTTFSRSFSSLLFLSIIENHDIYDQEIPNLRTVIIQPRLGEKLIIHRDLMVMLMLFIIYITC